VYRDPKTASTVPRTALRRCDHSPVQPVVFAVLPRLPRPGGDHGREETVRGSCHDLTLGPTVCAGIESADSARVAVFPIGPGGWRRPTLRSQAAALPVSHGRLCGETIEFMLSPNRDLIAAKLFLRLALFSGRTVAAGDQRRWASGVRQRDHRTHADRRTWPTLSAPNRALFKQYHRAGPSVRQEARYGEPRLPIRGGGVPNDRGL